MTCIVGIAQNNVVFMGADSAGCTDTHVSIRKDTKLFKRKNMLFGCTTSFRMIQILKYAFNIPEDTSNDPYEYLTTTFIDALRTCFKEKGFYELINEGQIGGQFLLGYKNRLFIVESDFSIAEHLDNFSSIGSGYYYALGSLYSTKEFSPFVRLKSALEAAEKFNTYVRSPFSYDYITEDLTNEV